MDNEILYTMVLSRINYFGIAGLAELYHQMGSATAVIDHRHHLRDILPHAHPRLVEALLGLDEPMKRAEAELEFIRRHHIRPLCFGDDDYPQRLRECDDAPLMLYYLGNADLNRQRVINIVGTRHATTYGKDLIRRFCHELREMCPDVLIVSGLAYGVDICAHREALACGIDTVGVLAHGLDDLYPHQHRETARQMVEQGGLLTEYMSQTNADKRNFIQRNRIVAGLSDACILVESAHRGGGLITARIAQSYHRDVFAFPGPVGAQYSEGCNNLIRDNGAMLITSAADMVRAMGWESDRQLAQVRQQGIERQLFPDLTSDEQLIVDALSHINDLSLSQLSTQTSLPVAQLSALLFTLEMKGVIRPLAGGMYHLLI